MAKYIRWYGDKFTNKMEEHLYKVLKRSGLRIASNIKDDLNKPQPPSKPGETPHKRTGNLARSIQSEMLVSPKAGEIVVRIGSDIMPAIGQMASYALMLEIGTSIMAKRPYLKPAVLAYMGKIKTAMKMK